MSRRRTVPCWSPTPVRPVAAEGHAQGTRPLEASPGSLIEPAARRRLEGRLHQDFTRVRVHTDAAAAAAAERERAHAFAVGEDVVFGAGRYAPGSPAGDALLAHELGHVVEQRAAGTVAVQRQPKGEPVTPPVAARDTAAAGGGAANDPDAEAPGLSLGISTLDDFAFDRASLTAAHKPKVADVAAQIMALLLQLPGGHVTITGHADLVGGEDVNLALGQRRADAVAAALAAAGVPVAALRTGSEGKRAPVVRKAGPEGRNRRVEVRFQGTLLVPGAGALPAGPGRPTLPSDRPRRFDLFPPVLPGAAGTPAFAKPGPAATPPKEPKGQEGPTRKASGGDVAKAVLKLPGVEPLIDAQLHRLDTGTTTGEKVALGTVGLSMASLAAAGILSDPSATKTARDLLDGLEVPLPEVTIKGRPIKGLSVKLKTKDDIGGVLQLDILKLVR